MIFIDASKDTHHKTPLCLRKDVIMTPVNVEEWIDMDYVVTCSGMEEKLLKQDSMIILGDFV